MPAILFMMTSSNGYIFRVTGHKGQWRGALMFSLICVWINDWVNNGEAGDLRRHRDHCGVIVILSSVCWINRTNDLMVFAEEPQLLCPQSYSWWRHQMDTFSALLAICAENSPVPGEFPAQRPVTRSFDVFFDLRLNKRLSKQWWGWWFETLSHPLWRHRNALKHAVLEMFLVCLPPNTCTTTETWLCQLVVPWNYG